LRAKVTLVSDPFDLEAADQVPYELGGGLALAVHGHARATKHIGLLVEASAISGLSKARRSKFCASEG
jgi:hypothetical protein